MRTPSNSRIKIFLVILFLVCVNSVDTVAQQLPKVKTPPVFNIGGGGPPIDDPPGIIPFACNTANNDPCNLIRNNIFTKNCPDPNDILNDHRPFFNNCVDYWTSSHGTPQLSQNLPKIAVNVNHASMFAGARIDANDNLLRTGEGIAVGIPALTVNTSYSLSLFKRYYSVGSYGGPDIDDFYVVLLKCSAFNLLRRLAAEDYSIPDIPSLGAQVIYHETDVNNTTWQGITQSFVANDTYDVLWIFPKSNTTVPNLPPGVSLISWLEVAYPELKNLTLCVSTGCTNPTITPSGPIDYYYYWEDQWIGKTLNSNFMTGNQWYKNGVAIPNANSPIYVAKEPGNYSVKIGTCNSNNVSIISHPYYASPPQFGQHIIPVQSTGYYCINTTAAIKQFDMGSAANYTWNTNPYPLVPSSLNIDPSSYNIHSPSALINIGNIAGTFVIQGTANLNGTEKVLDYHLLLTPQSSAQNFTVCASSTYYFGIPDGNNPSGLPGSSGFSWEYYDFGPNSIISFPNPSSYPDPSDPTNLTKIRIPGNSPLSSYIAVKFTGNSYVRFQGNYNWGGCYDYTIWNITTLNCFTGENNSSNNTVITSIYPNPASNNFSVSVENALIQSIEIIDLFGPMIKKVIGNNAKTISINIGILKEGIYNCKIVTNKGIEYKKIIIKR